MVWSGRRGDDVVGMVMVISAQVWLVLLVSVVVVVSCCHVYWSISVAASSDSY